VINWRDPESKVSRHFRVKDVTKGDPRRIPPTLKLKGNAKKLAKALDKVTDEHGRLVINSWYRDPTTNARVGGASNSQHLYGHAADVKLAYANAKKQLEFEQAMDRTWRGGVGLGVKSGKGFTHLDLGAQRRWTY
jgi:putative chitinase